MAELLSGMNGLISMRVILGLVSAGILVYAKKVIRRK